MAAITQGGHRRLHGAIMFFLKLCLGEERGRG